MKNLPAHQPQPELPEAPKPAALPAAKPIGEIREKTKGAISKPTETMSLEEAVGLLDDVYTKAEARMVMAECERRGLVQSKSVEGRKRYFPQDNPLVQKFIHVIYHLPDEPTKRSNPKAKKAA